MLSADPSHRLLLLLKQAIRNCKEEEEKLEEQVRQYRDLLKSWKEDGCGDVEDKPEEIPVLPSEPSAAEIQEVAMLTKALEKAMKVRASSKPQTVGASPSANAPIELPCPFTKKLANPSSKRAHAGRRPVTYKLNPPYKTNPEKKAGKSSRSASKLKTDLLTHVSSLPTEKDQCEGLQDASGDYTSPDKAIGKPVHPPSSPKLSETQDVQRRCTLKDIGRSLKLPAEYRRLYMQNNQLWEKFYNGKKRPPSSPPSFIERLQTTFEPSCPSVSLSELQEELSRLDNTITRIRKSVDNIKEWKGSGSREWQDYRVLLVYEAVLEEVNNHVSTLESLKQVAQQHIAWHKGHARDASCESTRSCPGPPNTAQSILHYNHPSDLAHLIHCKHRVLELKQRIYLQKVLNKELLSELEARCHGDPESLLLYRSVYTLLCETGGSFPVLVQEN